MDRRATPEMIARAAEWAAELDSDRPSLATRNACEAWCLEDPLHRQTLDRMRGLDTRFEGLGKADRGALRLALDRHGRGAGGKRNALMGMGAALLLTAGVAMAQANASLGLFPDYEAARGQQRTYALPDGSSVVLDTGAAMNFHRSGHQRTATLFRGRMFVTVAPDGDAPFVVRSRVGEATALGTAFSVAEAPEGVIVAVVESRVRACPGRHVATADCADLSPGQRAMITKGRVSRLSPVTPEDAAAWAQGWLEADDRPLTEVLTELNRYRATPIRFDPAALRGVRVTGSYPLTDSERAVTAIAATAGLRLSRSGAEVTVSPAS